MKLRKFIFQTTALTAALYVGLDANIGNAESIDCSATPDCASLGYTKSEADCSGKVMIKCPTDTSKVYCQMDLVKTCDSVGDVLYGNGKCAVSANLLDPNLTPVGVIFDTQNKLAVALKGAKTVEWSSSFCDNTSLDNCKDVKTVISSCGTDGQANTKTIISNSCNGTAYAASAAATYKVDGCSEDFCQLGQWFLPSMKELESLTKAKSTVNTSLTALGSKATTINTELWSSTEYDTNNAWVHSMMSSSGSAYEKHGDGSIQVRPVVYYADRTLTCKSGYSENCPAALDGYVNDVNNKETLGNGTVCYKCRLAVCSDYGSDYYTSKPDSKYIGSGCGGYTYESCTYETVRFGSQRLGCYYCPLNKYGAGRSKIISCPTGQMCCGSGAEAPRDCEGTGGCVAYK